MCIRQRVVNQCILCPTRFICLGILVPIAFLIMAGCGTREGFHLAYTDGQTIFGRTADTIAELATAAAQTLIQPGSVEGFSMTLYKSRRWIAWLEDDDEIRIDGVAGILGGSLLVESVEGSTRPGLATDGSTLYLSTSRGAHAFLYRSTDDGQSWTWRRMDLPFVAGCTDLTFQDGVLWLAITSLGHEPTDQVLVVATPISGINSDSAGHVFAVTNLPPGIDGSKGVRIVVNGDKIAVSCVSRQLQLVVVGIDDRRTGYVASGEIIESTGLSWHAGTRNDGSHGDRYCPAAPIFDGGDLCWIVSSARSQTQLQHLHAHCLAGFIPFEEMPAMTVYDIAIVQGPALNVLELPANVLEIPPNR